MFTAKVIFKSFIMIKSILKFGTVLSKAELKQINGGFLNGGPGTTADTCTLTLTSPNGSITIRTIEVFSLDPFVFEVPAACDAAMTEGFNECIADCDLHHT